MPTADQHIMQWKRNRRLAAKIPREFRDWQVNVLFYAALHAVDAALAKLGVEVNDHASRNDAIRKNIAFVPIRNSYLNLYRISRVTRYDPDPDKWIPSEFMTVNDLAQSLFTPIERHVEMILGKSLALETLRVED